MNIDIVTCVVCGEEFEEDFAIWVNDEPYCSDCYNENFVTCGHCGEIISADEAQWVDDVPFCEECEEEHCYNCDWCGNRHIRGNLYRDDNDEICADCYNNAYICVRCGNFFQDEDSGGYRNGDFYCRNCYSNIADYCYKPEPIFHGDGPLFMGLELEIDMGGGDDNHSENAEYITGSLGEFVYCKEDGSLSNGFEIVTHPFDLEYFYSIEDEIKSCLEKAVSTGYRSHDAGSCGIHVHIDRDYLRAGDTIAMVVFFFERFWNKIKIFSRRKEEQIKKWARKYIEKDWDGDMDTLYQELNGKAGKYFAVNITPYKTVELRIFRGSLKYSTLAATIEFAHFVAEFSKNSTLQEFQALTWPKVVQAVEERNYRYLPQYLKDRGLYPAINQEEEQICAS